MARVTPTDPAGDPAVPEPPVDPLLAPAQFRAGAVRLLAALWWGLSVLIAWDAVARVEAAAAPTLGLLAVSCAVAYAVLWQPAVAVDPGGVELVNVLRTVRVPWGELVDVDTRWALTLVAGGRRWPAWAAPSSGVRFRPVKRSQTPWADREDEAISGSRAPGSSAGEAAVLVLTRWRAWQDHVGSTGPGGGAAGATVTWRVNRPVVVVLAAATLVALLSLGQPLLG